MGSAPTFHLAGTRRPAAIIVMSAFSSIKNVVSDRLKILGRFVGGEYFNNMEKAAQVTSSTGVLLIHGKQDKMIASSHSTDL
tara:strand:- start:37 stop:282 length:246 start_codon:yes stop_codon:yes gene_type:complete